MTTSRRGGAMLGLVGLLIVVAIILYLMVGSPGGGGGSTNGGTGGTGYLGQMAKTKQTAEKLSIDHEAGQIATLVAQYRAEHDALPGSITDLGAGPTIENDKWGKPLALEFEGDVMTVISDGPDGERGTEDDIRATAKIPF